MLRERYQPKDVLVQQEKVARAQALAFVAPVHFLSFPAILKGWLDRVWTPGFAYDLTADAWRGDINGRQPRLTHEKALILQTTICDERHAGHHLYCPLSATVTARLLGPPTGAITME